MGRFVRDEVGPRKELVHRRIRTQEDAPVRELDRARMLHSAELVTREGDEIVFFEGEGDARIILHPPHGGRHLAEYFRNLGQFGGIGFPVIEMHREAVHGLFRHPEVPGDKREQIGGKRLCFVECQQLTSICG